MNRKAVIRITSVRSSFFHCASRPKLAEFHWKLTTPRCFNTEFSIDRLSRKPFIRPSRIDDTRNSRAHFGVAMLRNWHVALVGTSINFSSRWHSFFNYECDQCRSEYIREYVFILARFTKRLTVSVFKIFSRHGGSRKSWKKFPCKNFHIFSRINFRELKNLEKGRHQCSDCTMSRINFST